MTLTYSEKTSPSPGICVAPLKTGIDLLKLRYADLRSSGRNATHCVALRSGLRSTPISHLTCINIDHLEGCYAATQIRESRLRGTFAHIHVRADADPSLPSAPKKLSEGNDRHCPRPAEPIDTQGEPEG